MADSKKIDDGGAAFPQLDVTACERDGHGDLIDPFTSVSGGMSLRDWFAGQAIGTIIGCCDGLTRKPHEHQTDYFARVAYEIADAMLLAREGGGE